MRANMANNQSAKAYSDDVKKKWVELIDKEVSAGSSVRAAALKHMRFLTKNGNTSEAPTEKGALSLYYYYKRILEGQPYEKKKKKLKIEEDLVATQVKGPYTLPHRADDLLADERALPSSRPVPQEIGAYRAEYNVPGYRVDRPKVRVTVTEYTFEGDEDEVTKAIARFKNKNNGV